MTERTNQYNRAIEILRARPLTRAELAKALHTTDSNVRDIVVALKEQRLIEAPVGRRHSPAYVSLTPFGKEFKGWIPRLNTTERLAKPVKPRAKTEEGGIVHCAKRVPNSVFALGGCHA